MAKGFQTRTGFPGHLASGKFHPKFPVLVKFQTRTGFPGHLALSLIETSVSFCRCFKPERASQAI